MDGKTWLQREVGVLYQVTRAMNASKSRHEVLAVMLERIVVDLGYKAATLRILDEEKGTLNLKAAFGLSEEYLAKGAVRVSKSGIDQAVLTGKPVTLADVTKDSAFQYADAAKHEGLCSLLVVPMTLQDRVIGVLRVYTDCPHEFNPEEEEFIAAIANLGAQAVCRTHFFNSFRHIARNLNSTLDLKVVLRTLLLESVRELNVKGGSVRLLDVNRENLHLATAYGLSETYLKKGEVRVTQSPIDQQVLRDARPVAITDLMTEAAFQYPEEARREGIRSVLVFPLRMKDAVVGVMRLYSAQVRKFSEDEITFAAAIADLGAVAIENAKLHQALKRRMEELRQDADGWYRFLALG
jgi:GAF domain-containing protein